METMLKRHATFSYKVVKKDHRQFLDSHLIDVVHIQSNNKLVNLAMDRNMTIIVGPNMCWKQAPKKLLSYPRLLSAVIQRPDPLPKKLKPTWEDHIKYFPAFVDEKFFCPSDSQKTIDVLTIGKSFYYDRYETNLKKIHTHIKKMGLRHKYLKRYSLREFRDALNQSRILLFPSPKEAGATLCHALLECSMMNIPFIGLKSVVIERENEYHLSRGLGASTTDEMAEFARDMIQNSGDYCPRKWTLERYSTKAAYQRLTDILDET
jgi:hypothetical protein